MKKVLSALALALLAAVTVVCFTACKEKKADWQFTPGADAVEAEGAGVTEYSPTFTVNLQIIGGAGEKMFDGKVTLKSNTMMASEFLKAAVTDKGYAQDGIDLGFVTVIGDYRNDSAEKMYWGYKVNGVSPSFGCNTYQMRDGDYMTWKYEKADF